MKHHFRRGLPTMQHASTFKTLSPARIRQIQKALYNLKMTMLCGLVTVLVLRSLIGAGNFGTPVQDLNEIREFLPRRARVLTEMKESTKGEDEADDSVSAKVSKWRKQREQWLLENSSGKQKIVLATGSQPKHCGKPVNDDRYLMNKRDYCRLHDMEIFHDVADFDDDAMSKVRVVRRLMLSRPDVEWIWWMDADAILTDVSFGLSMDRYAHHNLVIHVGEEEQPVDDDAIAIAMAKSSVVFTTRSFLVRNCKWSMDLLDAWTGDGSEQGTSEKPTLDPLIQFLAGRRSEFDSTVDQSATTNLLTVVQGSARGQKVHLDIIDKDHPFITHSGDCKACGRDDDDAMDRCMKQMEKALNNQILEENALPHRHPRPPQLDRNLTDTPLHRHPQ